MSNILHLAARSVHSATLFSSLPPELQTALRQSSTLHRFSDGQIVQQRGDDGDGFWLIEAGSCAVGQFRSDGEFSGTALLGPGDSYGELAVFARSPRVVDAVSRGESVLRFIRASVLERALADYPQVMRPLLGALAAQLQETIALMSGIRKGSSAARIAGVLTKLAQSRSTTEAAQKPAPIMVTQEELADLLGLSRATVNSCLRELAHQRLIERRYGKIIVCDAERLRRLALI